MRCVVSLDSASCFIFIKPYCYEAESGKRILMLENSPHASLMQSDHEGGQPVAARRQVFLISALQAIVPPAGICHAEGTRASQADGCKEANLLERGAGDR